MPDRAEIPDAERDRLHAAVAAEKAARAETIAAVKAAKAAGGSVRTIADEIKRAPMTIQKWLHTATS